MLLAKLRGILRRMAGPRRQAPLPRYLVLDQDPVCRIWLQYIPGGTRVRIELDQEAHMLRHGEFSADPALEPPRSAATGPVDGDGWFTPTHAFLGLLRAYEADDGTGPLRASAHRTGTGWSSVLVAALHVDKDGDVRLSRPRTRLSFAPGYCPLYADATQDAATRLARAGRATPTTAAWLYAAYDIDHVE